MYSEDECEVYELTMDFEENSSTLHSGQQKLCVSETDFKTEISTKKHDVHDLLLMLIIILSYATVSLYSWYPFHTYNIT